MTNIPVPFHSAMSITEVKVKMQKHPVRGLDVFGFTNGFIQLLEMQTLKIFCVNHGSGDPAQPPVLIMTHNI